MDERLSLGIPDRSQIDAPARRFALIEERSRVSSIVPAILVASWGLLLKQVLGRSDEEPTHRPTAESTALAAQPEAEATAATSTADRASAAGSSELVRAFGLTSVSRNDAFEPAVDLDRLAFARTEGPRLSLVPANQNVPPSAHPQPSAGEKSAGGGGSGGGGGGGGGGGSDDRGKNHADDSKKPGPASKDLPGDPPKRVNHAPVSAGSVDLGSGLVNESIIISLSQLLTGTHDPDGDVLSVQSLQADHGSLQALGPDRWLYTPEPHETGTVQLSYRISDGVAFVVQTAHADLRLPPAEEIKGTDGDDFLIGTPRSDVIDAGAGNDIVYGREGNDTIYGGAGDDRLVGGDGDDTLFGGEGNDTMFGGAGNDTLFGEAGNDILYGEDGNDLILAGEGDDFASGGLGNDIILGGAGNDALQGDDGNDTIDGEDGNDHIDGGAGNDRLIGGAGDDVLAGGTGNDIATGGDGNDCLDGDAGDDTISGGAGNDHIQGGDGNDTISGGAGDDVIDAGSGDDVLILTVEGGHDFISGGSGADTLDLSQIVFDENVDLPDGIVEIDDGETVQIFEIENVHGGRGRDHLVADGHVNIMTGGDGDDTFVFHDLASLKNDGGPRDHIVDFSVGDRLDLSRVGQEIDDFAGKKLFFAGADQAQFDEVGAVSYRHEIVSETQEITVVTGNLDGTPEHQFEIVLDGNLELNEGSFVLAASQQPNGQHGS
jgi:Ca2+-binding RTX toxin-like protein